jgi:hypothetical protein
MAQMRLGQDSCFLNKLIFSVVPGLLAGTMLRFCIPCFFHNSKPGTKTLFDLHFSIKKVKVERITAFW